MTKSSDVLSEIVSRTKRALRGLEARPEKIHKHRYERRRIKEYLRQGNWWELSDA
jgi:hypothetical protein